MTKSKNKFSFNMWLSFFIVIIVLVIIGTVSVVDDVKHDSIELVIEFCNENPNDTEQCFCEEEKEIELFIGECHVAGKEYFKDGEQFQFFFANQETIDNLTKEGFDCDKHRRYINPVCTKARPKTECEKGNENFIEQEILTFGAYVRTFHGIDWYNSTNKTICREKTDEEKYDIITVEYAIEELNMKKTGCYVGNIPNSKVGCKWYVKK